ncbi:peptidase A24 [Micromonospora sp. RTP1Z1]|uniref:peptidase A24 n=1 Tax=Micromonospora sp. RTP1Z1 TaxID=2994043 RepID=UPI0029C921CB|nr:peptidase A24 [Micromonospora sp. RTP1Z1]
MAYRLSVPAGHQVRAGCHECGQPFAAGWRGWLSLPARCGRCRTRPGPPWWWCSGTAAAATLVMGWRSPAAHPADAVLFTAWLIQTGVLLSSVDVAVRRLPTPVVAWTSAMTAVLIAAAANLSRRPGLLVTALAASAVLTLFYLLLVLVLGSQVGMGDVRVAALTGLLLGASGWTAVVLGAVLPYLMALPVALTQLVRAGHDRNSLELPFGPFLLAAAALAG